VLDFFFFFGSGELGGRGEGLRDRSLPLILGREVPCPCFAVKGTEQTLCFLSLIGMSMHIPIISFKNK